MDENTMVKMTKAELDKYTADIKRQAERDTIARNKMPTADPIVYALPKSDDDSRTNAMKFARFIRARGMAAKNQTTVENVLNNWRLKGAPGYNDEVLSLVRSGGIISVEKGIGMTEGDSSTGGGFVMEAWDSSIIDLLRTKAVVRSSGVNVVDMPNGNLNRSKRTGRVDPVYVGEIPDSITPGKYGRSQQRFSAKKMMSQVIISNDTIRDSSTKADAEVLDMLLTDMALGEDLSFLFGAGTEFSVKGIYNQIASGNKFSANATASLDNVRVDILKAISLVSATDLIVTKGCWYMHPAVKYFLAGLTDGNGNAPFAMSVMEKNELGGFPINWTTQIPINLGGGSKTRLLFGNAPSVTIADQLPIESAIDVVGTYRDSNGELQDLRDTDQSKITAFLRHDLGIDYDIAFSVINDAAWVMT